jgi:CheY-like chemotaxis protein
MESIMESIMASALVIDDNRQAADSLCQLLELLEVSAEASYGPRAAMLALNTSIPGVIFLDLHMPGVDGFEVLAYLRRDPRLDLTPVIVITSDDQPETRRKALKLGAIDVIIKPARFSILETVLHQNHII